MTDYVANPENFMTVMDGLRGGDTVTLTPGAYGSIVMTNRTFSPAVTFIGTDGATFDYLDLFGTTGVIIEKVHIESPSEGSSSSAIVKIEDCANVELTTCEINGPVSGTENWEDYQGHYAVLIRTSSNVTVNFCNIHDARDGITMIGGSDYTIEGNTFDYMGHDQIKVISINGLELLNNTGARHVYAAPEAHKDFIQFGGGDSTNFHIRGNVYLAGNNSNVQGIFMDDAHFSHGVIEQNLISTGMLNGIKCSSGENIIVRNNTVLNNGGVPAKATQIAVVGINAAESTGNLASDSKNNTGVSSIGVRIQRIDAGAPWYYDVAFDVPPLGTWLEPKDFLPSPGRVADGLGAVERIRELIGEEPTPAPEPTPEPEPMPDPEPQPEPTPEPEPEPMPEPTPEPAPDYVTRAEMEAAIEAAKRDVAVAAAQMLAAAADMLDPA